MTHYAGLVRALARRLRQAQADSGMSQVAVTRKLRWSPSKTSRILSGDRMPSWVDMNALLRVYGADENLIEEMTDLWDIAENSEPKYAAFHHILTPNEIEYYEAIGDADEVLI
jgi:transcriptional regulator with XRE-family HTH domain